MSEDIKKNNTRPKRRSIWGWLTDLTFGNVFRFTWWSIAAIAISILIEWVGMAFFWELNHSQAILELEMSYLGGYSRNLITGFYPADLGASFVRAANHFVMFIHLRSLSNVIAETFTGAAGQFAAYGIDAVVNLIFIFAIRSAICVSALSGFLLVAIVAFIDGLVERDIRRAGGGVETATVYHHAKRFVKPLLFLSFGGYLTMPISVHPTLVFLPVMAIFGVSIYTAAKTYKKFV